MLDKRSGAVVRKEYGENGKVGVILEEFQELRTCIKGKKVKYCALTIKILLAIQILDRPISCIVLYQKLQISLQQVMREVQQLEKDKLIELIPDKGYIMSCRGDSFMRSLASRKASVTPFVDMEQCIRKHALKWKKEQARLLEGVEISFVPSQDPKHEEWACIKVS